MLANGQLIECRRAPTGAVATDEEWILCRLKRCVVARSLDHPVLLIDEQLMQPGDSSSRTRFVFASSVRPLRRRPAPPFAECGFGAASCFAPSPDGCDENLLVLLHGLGDSPANFSALGTKMALPQTAVLALAAPIALPFGFGGAWYGMNMNSFTP